MLDRVSYAVYNDCNILTGENAMEHAGVYTTKKKDGSTCYRVSVTYRRKHISLGSYGDIEYASSVYTEARELLDAGTYRPEEYLCSYLPHEKYIILLNFRDNGIYFPTPIYLKKQYFEYYLSDKIILKFDRDDLFFYAGHKIGSRGGYLYISDYGSQYKILGRYGVKPFGVYGRDYIMVNGDKYDFRYSNIKIINSYAGVQRSDKNGIESYSVKLHINGNYNVGSYDTEIEAAIAYNKAVDTVHANGFKKAYSKNYIVSLSSEEYHKMYDKTKISEKLMTLTPS